MNWHFLFFILDIFSWVFAGIFICSKINSVNRRSGKKRLKIKIGIILTALITGFLSVLSDGLPDMGFSYISLFYSIAASSLFAFYKYPKLRGKLLKTTNIHMG